MFKLLLVAEKNFRRLNAPELVREVYTSAFVSKMEKGNGIVEGCCRRGFVYTAIDKSSLQDQPRAAPLDFRRHGEAGVTNRM